MIFLPSLRLNADLTAAIECGSLRLQSGQWVQDENDAARKGRVVNWGASSSILWLSDCATWAAFRHQFRNLTKRLFKPIQFGEQLSLFTAENLESLRAHLNDSVCNVYGSFRKFRQTIGLNLEFYGVEFVRELIGRLCPWLRFENDEERGSDSGASVSREARHVQHHIERQILDGFTGSKNRPAPNSYQFLH